MSETILEVRDLRVQIDVDRTAISPVDGVSFRVGRGECLGLVGESGSGKSLTLRALLGLLPPRSRISSGELLLRSNGALAPYDAQAVRGHGIAMVFQEPMSALNPLIRVGPLIAEARRAGHHDGRAGTQAFVADLLREVGIGAPEERMRAYPHQLSGGLRQRVMIAMALASEPRVLLCDEPTTALDVTIQDQILRLLERIRRERGLSVLYVTHDLAVVGQICDRIAVMYAGRIVETGPTDQVLIEPAHPYTVGLLRSVPRLDPGGRALESIGGAPPEPRAFPSGCRFHPRCFLAQPDCPAAEHRLAPIGPGRATACIHVELLRRSRPEAHA
jgi:oligopeptide/dipeptide ABC transporter ATP-binding protein